MRIKNAGVLSIAAAMSLVLAACGGGADGGTGGGTGGGDGANGGSGGTDSSAEAQEGRSINETPREELQQGGTLRRAVTQLPEQWNPMHVNGNQADFTEIRDTMSVANFDYDTEANFTPNETYLLEYTEDETEDGNTVITLNLNPDATWNNGEAINAEDYQATLTACDGQDTAYECVQTTPYESIESVEQGEDEFEVIITFNSPYPDWSAIVSTVLPAESVSDAETFNTGWLEFNDDWFTGPFRYENLDAAQRVLTVVPNENWWGEAPLLDTISFRELEPDAAPQAFQNQELDSFEVGPSPNAYQIASTTPNAEVREALAPSWRHVTFNSEGGLMADQDLRQAIVMGIDRMAIAESDLTGLPGERTTLGNHFFMEGQDGYQDNSDVTPYDPEAAGQMLDDLGWVMNEGTGIREREGQPLDVSFTVLQNVPVSENEGQLIQNQLRELGVNVNLDIQPSAEFGTILDEGRFQMIAFSWIGTPYPMANIGQIYGNPEQNQSNYANLNNEAVNELIPQVASETDDATRRELTNDVDRLIWESVHTLPLYQRPELIATVANLANYGAFGFSTTRPENWGYTE